MTTNGAKFRAGKEPIEFKVGCHSQGSFRNGTVSIEGANLVFQMVGGNDLYKDECDHSLDKNSPTGPGKVLYPYGLRSDNGKMYLCWDEPTQKNICLEKLPDR